MIVNVRKRGDKFNWYLDTNEFTLSMLLQVAESGGIFEYVPNLREPYYENFVAVRKVLKGDRNRAKKLNLSAGDLQLF